MSCCKKIKEYIENLPIDKTNIIKFIALFTYHKEFSLEAYFVLKDFPDLYQALIWDPLVNRYYKRIFFAYFKSFVITNKLPNLKPKNFNTLKYEVRINNQPRNN